MSYFITGGTGFIGKFLVQTLLERNEPIYVLVREQSMDKFNELKECWGNNAENVFAIKGDLLKPNLGISASDLNTLKGNISNFYHLAAIYDLSESYETQSKINIEGTTNAITAATSVEADCFELISSIAVAGRFNLNKPDGRALACLSNGIRIYKIVFISFDICFYILGRDKLYVMTKLSAITA